MNPKGFHSLNDFRRTLEVAISPLMAMNFSVIHIDAIWLATELLDMRAGTGTSFYILSKRDCRILIKNRRAYDYAENRMFR